MNEAHKPLRKNNKFFRKIRCYIFHKKESFSNFASEKCGAPAGPPPREQKRFNLKIV